MMSTLGSPNIISITKRFLKWIELQEIDENNGDAELLNLRNEIF